MSAKAVRWKLERGVWVRVHPGVVQTLPGRDDWHTRALAAQLAVLGSAWSHGTAAYVHGLLTDPPPHIDLVIDERQRAVSPRGVKVHRRVDIGVVVDELHWPWRVGAAHTVLDLAALVSEPETLALLGRAFYLGSTTEATLRRLLATRARHRRRALLHDVLADVASGAESVLEVRYLRDVERAHGLPTGRRQAPTVAGGLRLHDVAYDEQRVLLELDGRLGHEGAARVGDGLRDRRSAGLGWLTVRAFWVDVAGTPCALATEVGSVLVARGWTGPPRPCRRQGCVLRTPDRGR